MSVFEFFWELHLPKSQADALLNRLARDWQGEFDAHAPRVCSEHFSDESAPKNRLSDQVTQASSALCQLLAVSAVVHADETSWSIHSVWAFLSEQVRVLLFGVHKDGDTLAKVLDPATYDGVVVSDDAAVYANFSNTQKCWAHLIRKAIKLTLQDPDNTEYRAFADALWGGYSLTDRSVAYLVDRIEASNSAGVR